MMASTADAWQEPDSTTGCAPWMRGLGRQVALELGQGREDVERELAARAELVQDLGRGWGGRSGRRWPSR
jgi:hypothetical protein